MPTALDNGPPLALAELVHEGALPVLELERSPGRRSLRVDEVGREEVGDRGAVAAVQDRARLSYLVPARLLGEGDGDEALFVGRGRRPVGRLQPGQFDIVDERAEEKAGRTVGAEAPVARCSCRFWLAAPFSCLNSAA